MASLSAGKFHVLHGGEFQRLPNLMYTKCKCSEVEVDLDYLSVDDMKEIVSKLGYKEENIKTIYFCTPNLPCKESLVSIECDVEVRELIGLLAMREFVCIYVEHVDDDKIEGGEEGGR